MSYERLLITPVLNTERLENKQIKLGLCQVDLLQGILAPLDF